MKKIFTFLVATAMSATAFCQQFPNASFETWTATSHPDSWGTVESALGSIGFPMPNTFSFKDSAHTAGTFSVRIKTDSLTIPAPGPGFTIIPGRVGLGSANYGQGGISTSGIPYTYRIDSMFFDYKLMAKSQGKDSGFIVMKAKKRMPSGSDSILLNGGGMLDTTSVFGRVKLDMTTGFYNSPLFPDTMQMSFYSSLSRGPQNIGTQMWLDNIVLFAHATNVGIVDVKNLMNVDIYPNPTSDVVRIAVPEKEIGAMVQILDMTGKVVAERAINSQIETVNVKDFTAGNYIVLVKSVDKITQFRSNLAVTK